MLLESLYKIVSRGAIEPLGLWLDDFRIMSRPIIPELKKMESAFHKHTIVNSNISNLIILFGQDYPNELELSKALNQIAQVFNNDAYSKQKSLIKNYIKDSTKFYHISQMSEFHHRSRESLKKYLSLEKQNKYDIKLFENEGMLYCLEYYLTMYKAIQDAPTQLQKIQYLKNPQVDLGLGDVPGLWNDFNQDEVLSKFIYLILDDIIRESLTKSYFSAKMIIMNYESEGFENINKAFKKLIQVLLEIFQKVGVKKLSSFFFTPYGDKPLIQDINL
ncbi:MAG: hypothetical protein V1898_03245 [Patescibacteria group bacterium]